METGSLMKVKSIAECPWSIRLAECPWIILQYIWTALSDNWYRKPIVGIFSCLLRQVLLYVIN